MDNSPVVLPPGMTSIMQDTGYSLDKRKSSVAPSINDEKHVRSGFWRDRFYEGGLILSMAAFYLIGKPYVTTGNAIIDLLLAAPFFLLFLILSWRRLHFTLALFPLVLPYYMATSQKGVLGYVFSMAEITLLVCLIVAAGRMLMRRNDAVRWREFWLRLGPFSLPIVLFLIMALVSISIAFQQQIAWLGFRKDVLSPILYLGLALLYLRSRQDITRLLLAFLFSGIIIAAFSLAQFYFFRNTPSTEPDGIWRVHAVYGSANSIGLFYDYLLPLGFALLAGWVAWKYRLLALGLCIPLLIVLYLSQSRGAWLAIGVAALFVAACAIRNRRILISAGIIFALITVGFLAIFSNTVQSALLNSHTDKQNISTVTKRIYLWRSAWNMISDRPWLGYGMDNWLCYYSVNKACPTENQFYHYWIRKDPVTKQPTGLAEEPNLSHPHNIFLHVWVSIGVFGLLAFVAVLVLFYWLFARILAQLRRTDLQDRERLRWMTVGVGAALLAALIQGQVDSAFLEQDLAYCFWMLIGALLILRVLSATPWRGKNSVSREASS